jgi:DNA mismatch repair protein MutL
MSLVVGGRSLFSTPGSATLRDVVACVHDVDLVEHLRDFDGERHGIRVRGLASHVGYTRGTRALQAFFVNGRWVRNRLLNVALEEAYHSMLMTGRHPVGFVHLEVPPDQLDVNVHPAKAEVRFLNEREVFGAIRHTVNAAITAEFAPNRDLRASDIPASGQEVEQLPLLDVPAESAAPVQLQAQPPKSLPALRVLGQAGALFIIAEGPDGVYMVDQHAAHERVLYDDLSAALESSSVAVQNLLEPVLVDLAPTAMDALSASGDLLHDLGFQVEPFGAGTCLVRAVPAMLGETPLGETLNALLDDLGSGKERSAQQERALATMACKAAVKAGQSLSLEEMRYLVQRLEITSRPRTCPHGRPTMILLSTSALERQFGRR